MYYYYYFSHNLNPLDPQPFDSETEGVSSNLDSGGELVPPDGE